MQNNRTDQVLRELCEKHEVPIDLMYKILAEERDVRHLKRRKGITDRIRAMIEKSLGGPE